MGRGHSDQPLPDHGHPLAEQPAVVVPGKQVVRSIHHKARNGAQRLCGGFGLNLTVQMSPAHRLVVIAQIDLSGLALR